MWTINTAETQFTNSSLTCILLNDKKSIFIQISMKHVPGSSIDGKSSLVQATPHNIMGCWFK